MKPVAIFRHYCTEGPGYFATYLERHGVPWEIVRLDAGDPIPKNAQSFSGIGFMGGPMSVNDPLPWIDPVLKLIQDSVTRDVPVIGHCLGGQLMAKALGGVVTRNTVKEIGWGEVVADDCEHARLWLGADVRSFVAFHWHGETFSLPQGARRILSSAYCANQGFSFGKHLALQCHVEMTAELIESWCRTGGREIEESDGPAVQSAEEIQRDLGVRLAALHTAADRLYACWSQGLIA
jgi:GMP synthase-like glutamine amidotransferase